MPLYPKISLKTRICGQPRRNCATPSYFVSADFPAVGPIAPGVRTCCP
jgi:hypothetical protein